MKKLQSYQFIELSSKELTNISGGDGLLTNIPVAGTLIESLGEIPLVGGLLDSVTHGLRIV